ncbi:MAG: hypothetical protein L3J28_11420 [Candidatus Polarisedimenticolaceae bacterium]|nr:hypothetical protein [Candidatus Polarisedimenticolaceae bacterium]
MGVRVKTGRTLLAVALGLSMAVGAAHAGSYPDIGPLPQIKISKAKAELGKRLFFDKRVSGDAAISCATCHDPKQGWSQNKPLSDGYPGNGHFRNSPSVVNAVHKKSWFHDGRIGTNLNDVTRENITETYIMNMDMRIMQERFKQDPVYVKMFKDAGYGEPSNGSVRKAIPEFLKTLTSRGAPFDAGKMSGAAKRGLKLFKGKAGCIQCHNGALLSDGKPHNTGVAENFDVFLDPMNHQAFIAFAKFQGIPNYMNMKRDPGFYNITLDMADMGKFVTPSLRELKYSAPYMHNGMINTLAGVVDFYNRGGGKDSRKSDRLKPLKLSKKQKGDLVAFLESLSGDRLTSSEHVWSKSYPDEYPAIQNWKEARN